MCNQHRKATTLALLLCLVAVSAYSSPVEHYSVSIPVADGRSDAILIDSPPKEAETSQFERKSTTNSGDTPSHGPSTELSSPPAVLLGSSAMMAATTTPGVTTPVRVQQEGIPGDQTLSTIVMTGDTMAVATEAASDGVASVILLHRGAGGEWGEAATVTPPNTNVQSVSTALDGGQLIIGLPQDEKVLTYTRPRAGWAADPHPAPAQVIPNPGCKSFGAAIGLSGGSLIIACEDASFIFTRATASNPYILTRNLTLPYPTHDGDTPTVVIDGGVALIGLGRVGVVASYTLASPENPLTATTLPPPSQLVSTPGWGSAVAIRGTNAAVGTTDHVVTYSTNDDGASWSIKSTITGTPNAGVGGLGTIWLTDTLLAVGAPQAAVPTVTVYRLHAGVWSQVGRVTHADQFGLGVAAAGNIVTALTSAGSGAVYTSVAVPTIPPGYRRTDNGEAVPCDAGTYQPSTDQPVCLAADPGYIVPADGLPHVSQTACDPNTSQTHNPPHTGCITGTPPDLLTPTIIPGAAVLDDIVIPTDGHTDDGLGRAVAVEGTTMVVGVPHGFIGDLQCGYILVYSRGDDGLWTRVARLTASTPAEQDALGHSVAIGSGAIVVGAPFMEADGRAEQGAVLRYVRPGGGWVDMTETSRYTLGTGRAFDRMGSVVGVDGVLIVTNPPDVPQTVATVIDTDTGGVYTITTTSIPSTAIIGEAVSLSGGLLVASLRSTSRPAVAAAVVMKLDRNDWVYDATLTPTDQTPGDGFGAGVAISGDTIAVTAAGSDDGATDAGAVYLFMLNDGVWTQRTKISAPDSAAGAEFGGGGAIALDGDTLVVGATTPATHAGKSYIFRRAGTSWTFAAELTGAHPGDRFGSGVAVHGSIVAVGAVAADGVQADIGGVYCYRYGESTVKGYQRLESGIALPCDNGTFQPQLNQPVCIYAAVGHHVPADGAPHITDIVCDAGKYQNETKQATCKEAGVGYHVPADGGAHIAPFPCDSGTFQPEIGKTGCVTADRGYHVPVDGHPHGVALPCDNGTYQGGVGKVSCDEATPGHYVTADGQPHITQDECLVGTHEAGHGAATCGVCDGGTYQTAPGQVGCLSCEGGMGPRFSTPDDGAAHTTCERWIDDDLDVADLKVDPTVLYPPMSDARFDGNECETVVGNKTWLVPMVSEGLPAGTHDLTITHGGEDIVLQVTLTEDYTTPAPATPMFDGTAMGTSAPGPICMVSMTVGGLGKVGVVPHLNATETGITCHAAAPVDAGDIIAHFPVDINVSDDNLCVTCRSAIFSTPSVVRVTVDGVTLVMARPNPHQLCGPMPSPSYDSIIVTTINGDTIATNAATPPNMFSPWIIYLLLGTGSAGLLAVIVAVALVLVVCLGACCSVTCIAFGVCGVRLVTGRKAHGPVDTTLGYPATDTANPIYHGNNNAV